MAEAARADRAARTKGEGKPPILAALDRVTGWSKASGKPAWDEERALFGGWRLEREEE